MSSIDLYKVNSRGGIQHWHCVIDYVNEELVIEFGVMGGNRQVQFVEVEENQSGRSIEDQLELEMESRAKKKLDNGFKRSLAEARQNIGTSVAGFPLPMLAHKVNYAKVDWSSAWVQRKYDGHRCLIIKQDNEVIAYTRKGLPITSIGHILEEAFNSLPNGATFDGELYLHGHSLQKIGSLIKREQPDSRLLNFICYDMISDKPFSERLATISFCLRELGSMQIAPTQRVQSRQEVKRHFSRFRQEGYEGAILRHGNHPYHINKRSVSLFKVKGWLDEEFEVVEILPSADGWAKLRCVTYHPQTKDPIIFGCSSPGSVSEKTNVLVNKEKFIGRKVKVEFSHWTDEHKPFHPIAVCWHEEI